MAKSSRKRKEDTAKAVVAERRKKSSYAAYDNGSPRNNGAPKVRNFKYYLAATVAVITFLVYLPALRNAFLNWDDPVYVSANPHIRSLDPTFFRWAFLDFYEANWHPLTWISHALDYAVWGLNPLGHHLTNNVFHSLNTFFAVVLIINLLEARRRTHRGNGPAQFPDDRAILIAGGAAGLLFGLHPIHVESVAWVTERKDLLCAFFFLLSILWYVKYAVTGYSEDNARQVTLRRQYLTSLAFFVLSLLSKPMAVTLPVVLLILDWYPFKRIQSLKSLLRVFLEKLPFIALSLISSILTIRAQRAGEAMQLMDVVPLPTRLLVAAKALIDYLWNMIWPLNLLPFYPHPKNVSLFSPGYILAIVLVAGITVLCVLLVKKQRIFLSVWGYYVLTLVPVLGIVQVGGQSMADRYTYLPSLGPFLLIGLGMTWVFTTFPAIMKWGPKSGLITVAAVVLLTVPLSLLTNEQIHVWENSYALWTYAIEKEPQKAAVAYKNRGVYFFEKGELDRAIEDDTKAIDLDPSYVHAYNNRGLALVKIGQFEKAFADYNKALILQPAFYDAHVNRALAFDALGQPERAIEDYDAAIALNPSDHTVYRLRGISFEKMGRMDKAIADYDRAIALNPSDFDTYYAAALSCAQHGLYEKAIQYLNGALAINPKDEGLWNDRGLAYFLLEQYDRALQDFNKAIALNRTNLLAYNNLGNLYLKTGNMGLAISNFQKACDLGNKKGCSNLQSAQLSMKRQAGQ